jgi:hypothetical protein
MIAVFVGHNQPESSLYFVAQTIQQRIPGSVICSRVGDKDLVHAELIVNLDMSSTSALVNAQKYLHFERMVLVLAGSFTGSSTGLSINDVSEQLALMGHVACNKFVVHSRHSFGQVQEFVRTWFSPAKSRMLMGNTSCILYGIEQEFRPQLNLDRNQWIVPYNRVSLKNVTLHHDVTSIAQIALRLRGVPVDSMYILTPELEFNRASAPRIKGRVPIKEQYPNYSYVDRPATRDGFRQLIAQKGMFLCTSLDESFGLYYLELLCQGTVGVFLDKPWVRTLLPGYPLLYQPSELAAGLIGVYEDWDRWHQHVLDVTIPYIRTTYNLDQFVKGLLEL